MIDENDSIPSERIEQIAGLLDPLDDESIRYFGSRTQHELTRLTRRVTTQVSQSSLSEAGGSLQQILDVILSFDTRAPDPNARQGFLGRLFGRNRSLAQFITAYQQVGAQIELISRELERELTSLLTDIVTLKKLYQKIREQSESLQAHLKAGRAVLERQQASPHALHLAQRVDDLAVSLQIAQQAVPTLALLQGNSEQLMSRINMVLDNTIPVWQHNMLQTIAIWRRKRADGALGDLKQTGSDLKQSSDKLADNARRLEQQMQEGVYDLDPVHESNQELIEAIRGGQALIQSSEAATRSLESELTTSRS